MSTNQNPDFNLPVFSNASSSSLMDAVVGRHGAGSSPRLTGAPSPPYNSSGLSSSALYASNLVPTTGHGHPMAISPDTSSRPASTADASPSGLTTSPETAARHGNIANIPKRSPLVSEAADDDESYAVASVTTTGGGRTESEWDVLSDASSRVNEERVEELMRKVEKRRSNLPYLTSQLAELEAQIKATEERLARAQGNGIGSNTAGPVGGGNVALGPIVSPQ